MLKELAWPYGSFMLQTRMYIYCDTVTRIKLLDGDHMHGYVACNVRFDDYDVLLLADLYPQKDHFFH
jgi:hypothetical protein